MHLQQISASFQPEELKVLEVKYIQPVIKKLTAEDLYLHTQALLLKIHVITGWKLPENEALLTILQDQVGKKLVEDYGSVNMAEIEFAFRKYGTSIKDWGKDVNLSFLDTVMLQYLKERQAVSDLEERMKEAPEKPKPTDEQVLSLSRENIELKYQKYLAGNTSFNMIPDTSLATLALDGFCPFDLYKDFVDKAKEYIEKSKRNAIEEYKLALKNNMVERERKELAELTTESIPVILLAKKMAVVYCFYRFKAAGYTKIYQEEK